MTVRVKELDAIIKKAIVKSGLLHHMKLADAAQEIWIKVIEKWPALVDREQVPPALLYWFSYRRAQDLKRTAEPGSIMLVEPSSVSDELANLGADPEPTAETSLRVKEILAVLTEREKAIFYELHVEGKSQLSVAEEHNISRSRVQQIEKAALEKMRREGEPEPPASGPRSGAPPPSSPPSSRK